MLKNPVINGIKISKLWITVLFEENYKIKESQVPSLAINLRYNLSCLYIKIER